MNGKGVLNSEELQLNLQDLPHFRYLAGSLRAAYELPSAAAAIDLLGVIGALAEKTSHHPDVDWRYNKVFVSTSSHDAGGAITARDIALAKLISEGADKLAAISRLDLIRAMEIAIDTDAPQEIAEQWMVGLGYLKQEDGSLADPNRQGPAIWFQETTTPNDNRLHVDVWLPLNESKIVIERLKQQDVLLDESQGPSCTVVSDQQGNRYCLCADADREPR